MGKGTTSALTGDMLIQTAADGRPDGSEACSAGRRVRVSPRRGSWCSPPGRAGGEGAYVSVVTLDAAFSFLEIQKEITGQVDVEVSTTDSSQRCFY